MQRLTLIIPACDRSETLLHTLETCVSQKDENLRILVSDNASQDSTKSVVHDFIQRDSRVEYINPGSRLGMSEHWEFALDHVDDGFVMIIGDDDGLLPDALSRIRKAIDFAPDIKAIAWPYCTYFYPDLPEGANAHFLPNNHMGICTAPGQEVRNYQQWLNYIKGSHGAYSSLPGVYHRVLHIDVLKKLKKDTGRYIRCIAPDIYVAVALSKYIDKFLFLKQPASLLGVSKKSNGFNQLIVDEHKNKIAKQHLAESTIHFHKDVPYTPSLPIFVAEALLQAKDAGALPDTPPIDWNAYLLQAHCILRNTKFNDEAEREMRYAELEEVCHRFGEPRLFERLNREKPDYDWTAHHSDPYDAVLDLSKLNIKSIADACNVAELLCLANTAAPPQPQVSFRRVFKVRMRQFYEHKKFHPSFSAIKGKVIDASAMAYRSYSWTYHAYADLRNKLVVGRR